MITKKQTFIDNIVEFSTGNSGILSEEAAQLIISYAKKYTNIDDVDISNQLIVFKSHISKRYFHYEIEILYKICKDVIYELKSNLKGFLEHSLIEATNNELNLYAEIINDNKNVNYIIEKYNIDRPIDEIKDPFVHKAIQLLMKIQNEKVVSLLKKIAPRNFVYVPPGFFLLGSNLNRDEGRPRKVWVSGYFIAKYPVSVAEFKEFIKEVRIKHRLTNETRLKIPAYSISWYEAFKYSKWRKARLPSEVEWEKAAKGQTQNKYPWGGEFSSKKANTFKSNINNFTSIDKYEGIGDSPYGVIDMVGNVWEWTGSAYSSYEENYATGLLREDDIGDRVLRGGAFDFDENGSTTTKRYSCNPSNNWDTHGFRLVYEI